MVSANDAESQASTDKLLTLNIIIIGDSAVGKTCLTACYMAKEFNPRTIASNGVDMSKRDTKMSDGTFVETRIWDTAG